MLFLTSRRNQTILLFIKRNDKQISDYRSVSLFLVFGNIFETFNIKSLFEYFDEQKFRSEHQSGSRPNDSCTNQLLSIVHNLYMAFDAGPTLEVWGVFLDMPRAFDKV